MEIPEEANVVQYATVSWEDYYSELYAGTVAYIDAVHEVYVVKVFKKRDGKPVGYYVSVRGRYRHYAVYTVVKRLGRKPIKIYEKDGTLKAVVGLDENLLKYLIQDAQGVKIIPPRHLPEGKPVDLKELEEEAEKEERELGEKTLHLEFMYR